MRPRSLTGHLVHPQITVRGRLTALYGSLFLTSGAVLLAIYYFVVERTFPAANPHQFTGGIGASVSGGFSGSPNPSAPPISPAGAAALDNRLRSADLHHLLIESCIALIVLVVLSVLVGWLVAGRVLRPLRTITHTARGISEDNLHERLALQGPRDELKDLGDTIDGLLARLEAAFDAQRSFVANASHELRTPLTVARTLLEMVLSDPHATVESFRAICQDVLDAGDQQEHLIEALLTLARSQRGLDKRAPLDLGGVVSDVCSGHQAVADARGVQLNVSAQSTPMLGDRALVERLVSNIVENAVLYNVPGGSVQVTVDVQGDQTVLRVINTGPVVAPGEIDRLLQPFQRLGSERVGDHAGLGLSIAHAIAVAHGGELHVLPAPGGGLAVDVGFVASGTTDSVHHPVDVSRTFAFESSP